MTIATRQWLFNAFKVSVYTLLVINIFLYLRHGTLNEALDKFTHARAVRNLLGEPFFDAFAAIKFAELEAYQDVVTAWEREHLLLKV